MHIFYGGNIFINRPMIIFSQYRARSNTFLECLTTIILREVFVFEQHCYLFLFSVACQSRTGSRIRRLTRSGTFKLKQASNMSEVPPTRMNQQIFKGKKKAAESGHKLLKKKADALKVCFIASHFSPLPIIFEAQSSCPISFRGFSLINHK